MKLTRSSGVRLYCPECDSMQYRAPRHCTLVLDEGVLTLLGMCPDCGVTLARPVFGPMLASILTLPIVVDPDVRDLLAERRVKR